jgi:hypothetical protein
MQSNHHGSENRSLEMLTEQTPFNLNATMQGGFKSPPPGKKKGNTFMNLVHELIEQKANNLNNLKGMHKARELELRLINKKTNKFNNHQDVPLIVSKLYEDSPRKSKFHNNAFQSVVSNHMRHQTQF